MKLCAENAAETAENTGFISKHKGMPWKEESAHFLGDPGKTEDYRKETCHSKICTLQNRQLFKNMLWWHHFKIYAWKCYSISPIILMQCAVQYLTVYSFYSKNRYLTKKEQYLWITVSWRYLLSNFFWFVNYFKRSLCIQTFILPVPFPASSKEPQIIACTLCRVKFHSCLFPRPEKWCCSLWNITLRSSANKEAINHQSVFQLGWFTSSSLVPHHLNFALERCFICEVLETFHCYRQLTGIPG